MNLLDTASLVVTPNGYKASKLYSIIPSDGTGDMTFARTGDTATRVNSSGLIESVLANKPRLDYLGGTCPKLLLEPQRTNLCLRSQEIDNATWTVATSNGTVTKTANFAVSPDGTTNAERIQLNLSGAGYAEVVQSIAITNGTSYTYSVYLKANAGTPEIVFLYDGAANRKVTLTSSWVRYTYTFTGAGGFSYPRFLIETGMNTSADILAYGAQLEAGAYATSYIPTTTASVTRNGDEASKTSATALIGQTEGTIFLDIDYKTGTNESTYKFVISDGTYNNYFYANVNTSNLFSLAITSGGSNQGASTRTLTAGRHKIALAYKLNDVVLYVDGVLISTDTSATIPACNQINIGNGPFSASFGLFNSVALWKTKLQNSELATLTSL